MTFQVCVITFQVGFTGEGKIIALDMNLYSNAGMSLDLSRAVCNFPLNLSTTVYQVTSALPQKIWFKPLKFSMWFLLCNKACIVLIAGLTKR